MERFTDPAAMRAWSRAHRAAGRRIGFVPTMGFLHEGHLSLVRLAHSHADVVAASIYVNPTQFGPGEDFDVYPRDRDGDLAKLEEVGCAAVFTPEALYARPERGEPRHETWVEVTELSRGLCGASRPGFFRGVATVVAKLFHIVEPDVAVFGRKDFQQSRVIGAMVRDLDFAIEIVTGPIVREPDGLAMSSRNVRLTASERQRALAIPGSLAACERALRDGERDGETLRALVAEHVEAAGGRVDYVELVSPEGLTRVASIDGPCVVAVAAWFGAVRLIDNREIGANP